MNYGWTSLEHLLGFMGLDHWSVNIGMRRDCWASIMGQAQRGLYLLACMQLSDSVVAILLNWGVRF